ncbi:phage protein NinX family protein [Cupriavidus sp. CuC1]|uniref:phage protein NinX family protein n=1 Tax=Cupriavidus sp. CuC1 TaxID=3373131 RepID=UPI0037D6FC01
MKVSEIDGPLLDYWVAKAAWGEAKIVDGDVLGGAGSEWVGRTFSPTTIWAQAGPLIEKERIKLLPPEAERLVWLAEVGQAQGLDASPLIAAMRAYVASKYGEEVPAE